VTLKHTNSNFEYCYLIFPLGDAVVTSSLLMDQMREPASIGFHTHSNFKQNLNVPIG